MTETIKEENLYKKGLWTVEEDKILMDHVKLHGKGQWNRIAKKTGLKRCGKSCRLRWMNYLSPSVKRGSFTEEEEDLIIRLHKLLGNRWSLIAKRLPGRTDNQVKNYWNTYLSKKLAKNKEQNSRVGETISSSNSRAVKVFETLTSSDSSPFCDATSAVTECKADRGTEKGVEVSEKQESEIEEGYLNSFLVSDNDLELSTFSMMDFLHDYSFYLA